MWGLSPSDNDAQINAYKASYGITNPCAGTQGGGPGAITIVTTNQNFLGYPTYCIVCPDKSMYFDVCWPPGSASCFDPYIADCAAMSIQAGFSADNDEICQYDVVNFTDQSTGSVTSWNWTFEGGDPATSTEQNPTVAYNDVGTFNVELEVNDGSNSNTMMIEDYISVMSSPPVMLQPFDDVCVGWPAFELSGGSPAGGVYSGTGVDNGWFDPEVAGLGTHNIYYTFTGINGCDNTAMETILVDPCTGVGVVTERGISIYPNPAKDQFTIQVNKPGIYHLTLYNVMGLKVFEENRDFNRSLRQIINPGLRESGLYLVDIESANGKFVQKIRFLVQ